MAGAAGLWLGCRAGAGCSGEGRSLRCSMELKQVAPACTGGCILHGA